VANDKLCYPGFVIKQKVRLAIIETDLTFILNIFF